MPLDRYREKRNFGVTPEPGAEPAQSSGGAALRFVVQKHAARRLHYDFRLECDGVLKSWAVPKGPSLNPDDKRMAVMTEDHPLSYAGFEGQIPKEQYGGGEVIVWDEGTYIPDEYGYDPFMSREDAEKEIREGVERGKISVTLHGVKLHGSFTLVKTKLKDQWLLIKHRDAHASDRDVLLEEGSVLSRRTISDVATGKTAAAPTRDPALLKAPVAAMPDMLTPMMAGERDSPFTDEAWAFEAKLDGIRAVTIVKGGRVRMVTRNGKDIAQKFPEIVADMSAIPRPEFMFDGEIVTLDAAGKPTFQGLMDRFSLGGEHNIRMAMKSIHVLYYVFDVMFLDGHDLRKLPYSERREILERLAPSGVVTKLLPSFATDGELVYKHAVEMGYEGMMAKKLSSTYQDGKRTPNWLKIKPFHTEEFIVCGYTVGEGARGDVFGSLILGQFEDGKLAYTGNVGSGFSDAQLPQIRSMLDPLAVDQCPFGEVPEMLGRPKWVEPRLWVEVKFQSWTREHRLRAPVFLHMRPDLEISTALSAGEAPAVRVADEASALHSAAFPTDATAVLPATNLDELIEKLENQKKEFVLEVEGVKLNMSNLDKVLWPGEGEYPPITKREYLKYLAKLSPFLLPHLRDRPITITRYPDGIHGGMFFQKHAEGKALDFLKRVEIFSKHNERSRDFLLCNDLPTLMWFGQMAALEIHPWYSRIALGPDTEGLGTNFSESEQSIDDSVLDHPDFMVVDLDPYLYSGAEKEGDEPEFHEAGFREGCAIALEFKKLLDGMGAHAFVKTSGKTGLHIYVPIVRSLDYDTVRALAETFGIHMTKLLPGRVTVEWAVPKRTGKVFFDYNQNSRGKTLASIYSPRPTLTGTVSFPVAWEDLMTVDPRAYTVHTAPEVIAAQGDLWARILLEKQDLKRLVGGS